MTMLPLILTCSLIADTDFAPRIEVLRTHLEGLQAVTVPRDLEEEKQSKIETLRAQLEAGAQTIEDFNGLYFNIDAVRAWLWAHAADKPGTAEGTYNETPEAWVARNPQLTLSLARADLTLTVQTPKATWRFQPCDDTDLDVNGKTFGLRSAGEIAVEEFRTGYSVGMLVTLTKFPDAPGLELRLCLNLIGSEAVFEVAAVEDGFAVSAIDWPKAVEFGNAPADLSVIPHMQGMLLPGDWPQEIHEQDLCNSRTLYMPWWGQIHEGRGVQTILETSDDAGAAYDHPAGGPTRIRPRWYASLGKVRYARSIRYVFDDEASYVGMAKRYRRFVDETGRFVSLNEKRVRTPNLDEVIGRPVIHTNGLYHFVPEAALFNKERVENNHGLMTFAAAAQGLRDLRAHGVEDAYVHFDGWGFYGYDNGHPDVLPPGEEQGGWAGLRLLADACDELGYLFAVHDQYRDFYFNAASFDDRLTVLRADGTREEHSTWCGGPQTILSPRFAPGYVRRNHDLFARNGVEVRGAYLDVFSVVPLEESFQQAHPMTRTECARYRRECFELLRARGYVVSSEEPSDYLAPTLHLVHHGPYGTYPKFGGGDARGVPVPLWSLVYHDALLVPWEMGDDGGWGVPKGDAAWLHCLLNAGMPYVGIGASAEQIARVKEAAALNRRCATLEMTNHEFLDDAFRKQRTTFSDGTTVTVDFVTRSYSIEHAD